MAVNRQKLKLLYLMRMLEEETDAYMLVKTYCAAVNGLEVTTVTVEVSLNRGVNDECFNISTI